MIFIFSLRKRKLQGYSSAVPFFRKKKKIIQLDNHSTLYFLKKRLLSAPGRKLFNMTGSPPKTNLQVLLRLNISKAQQQNDCTGRSAVCFLDLRHHFTAHPIFLISPRNPLLLAHRDEHRRLQNARTRINTGFFFPENKTTPH